MSERVKEETAMRGCRNADGTVDIMLINDDDSATVYKVPEDKVNDFMVDFLAGGADEEDEGNDE